jgi:hypothetical protein
MIVNAASRPSAAFPAARYGLERRRRIRSSKGIAPYELGKAMNSDSQSVSLCPRSLKAALACLLLLLVSTAVASAQAAGDPTAGGEPSDLADPTKAAEGPSVPPGPAQPAAAPAGPAGTSICLLIESAALAHGLPFEFFARLIWQESRFQPNAVGPVTRGGRAQGIAQFMPATAGERGLVDPFDPVAALPKSAEYLAELHSQFGNLGFAAAAYNAGPRRVRDWLGGKGALPAETRRYVMAITGRSVEDWAMSRTDAGPLKRASCGELMALLKEGPSPFIGELERRVREGRQRERVLAAYATLEKTYRTILENRDPIIVESQFRSRGTRNFYQVRIGADTRIDADVLCAKLHKAGGACLVLRNSHGVSSPL